MQPSDKVYTYLQSLENFNPVTKLVDNSNQTSTDGHYIQTSSNDESSFNDYSISEGNTNESSYGLVTDKIDFEISKYKSNQKNVKKVL